MEKDDNNDEITCYIGKMINETCTEYSLRGLRTGSCLYRECNADIYPHLSSLGIVPDMSTAMQTCPNANEQLVDLKPGTNRKHTRE